MENKHNNINISEITLSPFIENNKSKKIKEYAKKIIKLHDFKNLKICLVQYNDINKNEKYTYVKDAKTKAVSLVTSILPYNGYYDSVSNNIMIFIDNHIKYGKFSSIVINLKEFNINLKKQNNYFKKTCCSILKTLYHEKKHYLQQNELNNSYDSIITQMETNLKGSLYGSINYTLRHDDWYIELDADMYAINNTLNYYKNNPEDQNVDFEYLNYLQKITTYKQYLYDFDKFFNIYNIYKEKLPIISNIRSKLFNRVLNDKSKYWHLALYDENNNLRNIDEIINNSLLNDIDEKFINNVLTSKYINNKTNYDGLDIETLKRLKFEFEKKVDKTKDILNILVAEKDNNILRMIKKDLERLRNDLKYCENTIIKLQNKILEKTSLNVNSL